MLIKCLCWVDALNRGGGTKLCISMFSVPHRLVAMEKCETFDKCVCGKVLLWSYQVIELCSLDRWTIRTIVSEFFIEASCGGQWTRKWTCCCASSVCGRLMFRLLARPLYYALAIDFGFFLAVSFFQRWCAITLRPSTAPVSATPTGKRSYAFSGRYSTPFLSRLFKQWLLPLFETELEMCITDLRHFV